MAELPAARELDAGAYAAVAATDDTAFLAARHELVGLAYSVLRSREEAEDAVQEVWLRWQRHRGAVSVAPAWLRTVTRNLAIDRLRARSADHDVTTALATLEQEADPAPPAVEAAVELQPACHALLGSLSLSERVVFVLRNGLDWSYGDIGRLLDRSEAAVRQVSHRARHHLASGVQRYAVDPATAAAVAVAYLQVTAGTDVWVLLDKLAPGIGRQPSPRRADQQTVLRHDVVGVALFRGDRLVLCRRRDDLDWYPGVWDVPGGHRGPREPVTSCAARTAQQRLGVGVSTLRRRGELAELDFRIALLEGVGWIGRPRNLAPEHHVEIAQFTREEAARLELADRRLLRLFDRHAA